MQHGADINNRGGRGCKGTTPLIDAATNGHIEIMELLIKYGANVIAKDDHVSSVPYCTLTFRQIVFWMVLKEVIAP